MKTSLLTLAFLTTSFSYGAQATPDFSLTDEKIDHLYAQFRGFASNPNPKKLPPLLWMRIEKQGFKWGHIQYNFIQLAERLQKEVFEYEKKGGTPPFDLKTKRDLFLLMENDISAMSKQKKATAKK